MPNEILKKLLESMYGEHTIESYSQLAKALSGHELSDIELLLEELKNMSFIEDESVLYNKLPMAVYYRQLPVIKDADVLVKVVLMQQSEGLVLVVPENVVSVFEDLLENPDLIIEKNNHFSLYAEVYNLDSDDEKLHDLIKEVYLNSGSGLKAFDLKDELMKDAEEGETDEEVEDSLDELDDFDFEKIEGDLPEMEDIEINEEAYKKFKKQSNYLENLIKKLNEKAKGVLKKNVRVKFFHNVLIIEVNNKSVYKQHKKIPVVAKKLLTNFGESIRINNGTQLVDSFSKDGKRYFVVAENLSNNYWYVIKEDMEQIDEDTQSYITPRAPVKLRKSSIRKESRAIIPYKKGRKIIFVSKTLK